MLGAWYLVIFFVVFMSACNSGRHQIPITTNSDEARQLFVEGRYWFENALLDRADSLLEIALQFDPDFALAYLFLSAQNGLPKAKELASTVSEGEALLIELFEAFYQEDSARHRRANDNLIQLFPKDKHLRYLVGLGLSGWDSSQSIYHLRKAIDIDPNFAPPYNLLAFKLYPLGLYDEALECLEKYLDFHPNSGNANDSFAEMLMRTGDLQRAIVHYRRVVDIDPYFSFAYVKIAWIYLQLGDLNQARFWIEQLANNNFRQNEVSYARSMWANIAFIQGNTDRAIEMMDQYNHHPSVANDPEGVVRNTLYKGWYAFMGDRPDKAIETFTHGFELLKNISDIESQESYGLRLHCSLSLLYGKESEIKKSEEHLNQAKQIYRSRQNSPGDQDFFNCCQAGNAIQKGDYSSAINFVKVSATRTSIMPKYYLALAYDSSGQYDQAIEYYTLTYQSFSTTFTGFFFNTCKNRLDELKN